MGICLSLVLSAARRSVPPFAGIPREGTPPNAIGGHHIIIIGKKLNTGQSSTDEGGGAVWAGHSNGIITVCRYEYSINAVESDGILAENSLCK